MLLFFNIHIQWFRTIIFLILFYTQCYALYPRFTSFKLPGSSFPNHIRAINSISIQNQNQTNAQIKFLLDSNNENQPNTVMMSLISTTKSVNDQLNYYQTMIAGALSRTMAQTLIHPIYTYKTLLQMKHHSDQTNPQHIQITLTRLLKGVDAQFLLSLPHGAFYFMVIDQVKNFLHKYMPKRFEFLSDFTSSAISTIICSIVSTPQMVITDRLMAGMYSSFPDSVASIFKAEGIFGFYRGWWPALAQKIPSYGLTWVFFQQLKRVYKDITHNKPSNEVNFLLGALAAAGSVTAMIPLDTIKTRLVLQTGTTPLYTGITDCFLRIVREEGIGALYRSLPPRLVSVVPMIAIQFGVYEFLKGQFIQQNIRQRLAKANQSIRTHLRPHQNNPIVIINPSSSSSTRNIGFS